MKEIVAKQVELHLIEYKDVAPTNPLLYVVYLQDLTVLYTRRFMTTWIHILLFAWLLINVMFGAFGWWFEWLPVLTMAFMAFFYRIVTQE